MSGVASWDTAPASPVFIVGSPRSGTSILIASLLRAGYGGFLEGNFLSLIQTIERDVERHFSVFYTPNEKVLTSRLDRAALKEQMSRVIVDTAVAQQPTGPWVDKTGGPEMIQSIPVLRRLLPGSRFIFAKRRAIENVVSRVVKFPNLNFGIPLCRLGQDHGRMAGAAHGRTRERPDGSGPARYQPDPG